MNNAITIVQILLALAFALVGLGKLTQPQAKLAARMAWVNDFTPQQLRLIGALELCAAIGIILSLFLPSVSMWAAFPAVGLALVMSGAMATHLRRNEYSALVPNLILLTFALFVAYGRLVGF